MYNGLERNCIFEYQRTFMSGVDEIDEKEIEEVSNQKRDGLMKQIMTREYLL